MIKMIRQICILAIAAAVVASTGASYAAVQKEDIVTILEPMLECRNLSHFAGDIFIASNQSGERRFVNSSGQEIASVVDGYVNEAGQLVIPLIYDHAVNFREGLGIVAKDGKYGYIDTEGNVIIPLMYEDANEFSEGLAAVKLNGKYGYINTLGEVKVPFEYGDRADALSQGRACVEKNEKYGYIDTQGNVVIPLEYDDNWPYLTQFKDGIIVMRKDYQHGYYDLNGQLLFNMNFVGAYNFQDGYGIAKKGDKWGAIDTSGNTVVPFEYDAMMYRFSEGKAVVMKDGKWGHVDTAGNVITALEYDDVLEFCEGYARVQKNRKYGYVDKEGKLAVPLVYDNAYYFENGLAIVEIKDGNRMKTGLINTEGEVVLPLEYRTVRIEDDGWITVSKDDKYGILRNRSYQTSNASESSSNQEQRAVPNLVETMVDGETVLFSAYQIEGYNYIKLRDLAQVLSDSQKTFSINWDSEQQAIRMESGQLYTDVGQASSAVTGDGAKAAVLSKAALYLDGDNVTAEAYTIDGNTWFKLRDLGDILGFLVEWDVLNQTVKISVNID